MRIIAYRTSTQDNKVLLEESTGESVLSNDIADLFFFLIEQFEDEEGKCIKITWNVDATVSLFLKLLGVLHSSQLWKTKRCHVAPFEVFYVPGKVFSVVHIPTKQKANLYGIEQYFPELDEPSLPEVEALGKKLVDELKKMGMIPTKLTSPVAIYEECVMRHLDLPKLKDIPIEVAEFAYRASGRLWIETHQIGYWE